jgi:Tol biopolymer transport system component
MRRLVLLALALAAAVPAAAAERQSLGITFINEGGLFGVGPDDSSLSVIREHLCPPGGTDCPVVKEMSWSPDGNRLAYTFGSELYLFDNRTGTQRLLPTGVDVDGGSRPAWSPDGRELAFISVSIEQGAEPGRSGSNSSGSTSTPSDLYVIDLDQGAVRRLTTGRQTADPAWAPGSQIVYSSIAQGRWELFIIDPGGEHRRLSDGYARLNRRAAWSPDGTRIAFLRDGATAEAHLNTIRADGSEMRQLSSLPIDVILGAQPAWSPDGSMLAVTTSENSPVDLLTGSKPGRDLYVVAADGSGERRLTHSGERGVSDRGPTWAADGSRLAFESLDREKLSHSALYTVRADGTCERRVAVVNGWRPVWQPLLPSGIAPQGCADLAVVGADLNRYQAARLTVTLLNDGTTPLVGIRLRSLPSSATIMSASSRNARCTTRRSRLDCRVGLLRVGESVDIDVLGEARVLSRVAGRFIAPPVRLVASASTAEISVANNAIAAPLLTTSCTTGTRGAGLVRGTERDDDICGRTGRDRILGLEGDDRIASGRGADFINAGPGKDVVSCGAGHDRVIADRADRVARDCERVRRTGS